MKTIITAAMALALIALISTPLIAESESWIPNSDQLIAQANDSSETWVSNSDQLIAQDNDNGGSWVSNSDQIIAQASDANEIWVSNSANCPSQRC